MAAQAAFFGKRVIVFQKESNPGSAAVQTGTLPSKTLRESSVFLSGQRSRQLYGVAVELDRDATLGKLISRTDAIRDGETSRIRDNLERHGVINRNDHAVIEGPHTVRGVESVVRIETEFILIATGSEPRNPDGVDFAPIRIHDRNELLTIDELPWSRTIIGAGVIGCEYPFMFHHLGSEITIVDKGAQILTFLDREIVNRFKATMENSGIRFILDANWQPINETPNGIETTIREDNGTTQTLVSKQLLLAAGLSGSTRGIGLEHVGLEPNAPGQLTVDGNYAKAVPSILAAGDVIGFPALAGTSMEQGRVVVCRAFDFEYKADHSELLRFRIYAIPELSAVGETEQSAQAKGLDQVCGRALYLDNPRGLTTADTVGITKLIVECNTRQLIGIHLNGERASNSSKSAGPQSLWVQPPRSSSTRFSTIRPCRNPANTRPTTRSVNSERVREKQPSTGESKCRSRTSKSTSSTGPRSPGRQALGSSSALSGNWASFRSRQTKASRGMPSSAHRGWAPSTSCPGSSSSSSQCCLAATPSTSARSGRSCGR